MTVRELLSSTDSRELSEWMVFFNQDYWREKLAEELMTDADRSAAIKRLFTGGK